MPSSASSGTQLGRYEVLQALTSGGITDLLLARATGIQSFERHVVIKRIRADVGADKRFVASFLEEARLAAALHHQNVVQVYDVGEQDGAYFFAMEYVHGEDLRRLIQHVRKQHESIPIAIAIAIVNAAAAGLHHAHERQGPNREPLGIVHRDVSPGNILVGYDGSVKLVDFGLAKAALGTSTTRAGALAGKAAYMSPEQCNGLRVDRRSDVFGLGILLFELLTTRRLFHAANDYLTMQAIVVGNVPPPSRYQADLPRELDDIVLRALAKSPDARYPTAEALRAALEQLAVENSMHMSTKALADYMRATFGERLEPWRSDREHSSRARTDELAQDSIVTVPDGRISLAAAGEEPTATSPLSLARVLAESTSTITGTDRHEFVGDDATIATAPPDFHGDVSSMTTNIVPPHLGDEATRTTTTGTMTMITPDELNAPPVPAVLPLLPLPRRSEPRPPTHARDNFDAAPRLVLPPPLPPQSTPLERAAAWLRDVRADRRHAFAITLAGPATLVLLFVIALARC